MSSQMLLWHTLRVSSYFENAMVVRCGPEFIWDVAISKEWLLEGGQSINIQGGEAKDWGISSLATYYQPDGKSFVLWLLFSSTTCIHL